MPFDVRVEAHVARPPEAVAAYMFDPTHDPEWITGIEQVDPPAAPVGVGTETHRLARFMSRRIDYVLASPRIAERATQCKVLADVGTSDHAPIMMEWRDS